MTPDQLMHDSVVTPAPGDDRLVIDALPLGVIWHDAAGRIVSANPAAERILGAPLDQMRGATLAGARWRTVHEDGSPFDAGSHPVTVALRTATVVRNVVMGVRDPMLSAPTWISVSAIPVLDASGGITAVYAVIEDITMRQFALQKLRDSDESYRQLFAYMAEGVAVHRLVFDADGRATDYRILDVNAAFEAQAGIRRDAVVGRLASEAYGSTQPPFIDIYARVTTTGVPAAFDASYAPLGKDFRIQAFRTRPDHFATIFSDVTEARKAERELRASQQMYRTLTESMKDVVWTLDAETLRFLYISPSVYALRGYTPEEIMAEPMDAALTPDAARAVRAMAAEKLALFRAGRLPSDNYATNEVEQPCKDGTTVWTEVITHYCLNDETGRVEVHGVTRDITERRRSESERRLLSVIAERAGESIALVRTGDGIIVYTNDRYDEMLGYGKGELLARHISVVNAPSGRPPREIADEIAAGVEAQGSWRGEVLNRRKDGSTLWTYTSVTSFHHPELGQLLISHQTDITARKNAEQELIRHRDQLGELVAARTAELQDALARAETASLAKSAFLANMSHEIRTPMNGILGMAYLVRRDGLTPKQEERIDKLTAAGRHLLAIINDVLDLAKIESGQANLKEREFPLSELLAGVADIVEEGARSKGLSLTIDMAGMPKSLVGDITRLKQALLNYLANAVKFTERGGIALKGRVLGEATGECRIRFEVVDTGIGIAPEVLPRLFAPFQQADQSLSRAFGGTGLGLVITKRIAALMGGDVGAESTPDGGSRFWMTVRLRRGHDGAGGSAAPSPDSFEARLRREHGGTRVLLAEDNDLNREIAVDIIRAAGLVADVAADGEQAVRLASATDYALILMDIQMPSLNGLEATRAIRRLPERTDTPIVAMTAAAFDEDRAACFEAGMNDFIGKPLVPEQLFAVLLEWLGRRRLDPRSP